MVHIKKKSLKKNYINKKPTETQGKVSQKESGCVSRGCIVEYSLKGDKENQSNKFLNQLNQNRTFVGCFLSLNS